MSATELFADGAMQVNRAAEEFGVSRARLYEWMQSGKLPYTTASGRRLIPRRALQALLAADLVGAAAEAETTK